MSIIKALILLKEEESELTMETTSLPVAIIGAGPIGLAAAAHLLRKGETPLIFEAGASEGAAVLQWGHVRLFSPWRELLDREATALLAAEGWIAPDPEAYPTGRELVEDYLAPLANTLRIKRRLRLQTRVVAVSRQGLDKMKTPGREEVPFVLRLRTASGEEQDVLARAVLDASGTYQTPNPLGAHGIPALREQALREYIFYGIPDILGHSASVTPVAACWWWAAGTQRSMRCWNWWDCKRYKRPCRSRMFFSSAHRFNRFAKVSRTKGSG